jgi:hypothetical protein
MITAIIGPLYFIGCMTELSPIVIMTEITYEMNRYTVDYNTFWYFVVNISLLLMDLTSS